MKNLSDAGNEKRIIWNTRRPYSPQGQVIAAQAIENGVIMVDVSRGVSYYMPDCELNSAEIMSRYDALQRCLGVAFAYRQIERDLEVWTKQTNQ